MAQNSWREIADVLGKDPHFCRKSWKNLRDRFVKAKKRAQGKSGDPGGSQLVSPILNELGWLSQFIKHRETDTNFESEVSKIK